MTEWYNVYTSCVRVCVDEKAFQEILSHIHSDMKWWSGTQCDGGYVLIKISTIVAIEYANEKLEKLRSCSCGDEKEIADGDEWKFPKNEE